MFQKAEDCVVFADIVLLFLILNQAVSRQGIHTPVHLLLLHVLLLSCTIRPSIDRSVLQQRRKSYSDDAGQEYQLGTHNRSNPPTLPRRTHPPTFKPVPPPTSPTPGVYNYYYHPSPTHGMWEGYCSRRVS